MRYLIYYAVFANAMGALLSIYDKLAAKNGWRRVPERTLFLWALLGGGIGVYASMLLIRHKTLHLRFMLGIPLIVIWQGLILFGIYVMIHARGGI